MFNETHKIADEFPEFKDVISRLKQENDHFAKLAVAYEAVTAEIHKIDEQIETPSDAYTEDKKKERLALKDQLFALIQQAA